MAKAKKDIPVDVKVRLDTSQVVDLSAAVEAFVAGLADSVSTFCDEIQYAFKGLASDIEIDCQNLRETLPNLPTYATDDDEVALPDCTTLGTDCACNQVRGNLETR